LHAQHLISLDKILSLSKSLFGGFNLSDIFLAIQNVALRRLSEYFNGNIGAKSNRQVQLILFVTIIRLVKYIEYQKFSDYLLLIVNRIHRNLRLFTV